jgi:prepilin-type N-terminal cleavage/methylation domain-containing protein
MRNGEKGYTLIELIIATTIAVLVSGAASIAIFQVMKGTETNNTHMSAVQQVQTAGYWISRDIRMAQSVNTDNLTPPDFLVFNWVEWDEENEKIFHSANYSIEGLTDGIGKLKRTHWSSVGANETTLIATNIYYDPADSNDTSKASYQPPVLTLQLTSLVEDAMEVREYRIKNRPNAY